MRTGPEESTICCHHLLPLATPYVLLAHRGADCCSQPESTSYHLLPPTSYSLRAPCSVLRAYRRVDHLLQPARVERVVVLLEPRDLGRLGGLLDDLGRVVDHVTRVVAHLRRVRVRIRCRARVRARVREI